MLRLLASAGLLTFATTASAAIAFPDFSDDFEDGVIDSGYSVSASGTATVVESGGVITLSDDKTVNNQEAQLLVAFSTPYTSTFFNSVDFRFAAGAKSGPIMREGFYSNIAQWDLRNVSGTPTIKFNGTAVDTYTPGEWVNLAVFVNLNTDEVIAYVDGQEVATDTTTLTQVDRWFTTTPVGDFADIQLDNLVFSDQNLIPEPGSLALGLVGVGMLMMRRR